ncbi:hypothetical protein [Nitrosopumilus piranensis]|uniref:hypothetical protein n=1 Tax=Nitrosopumilus piranensis TaxID=1582439 RepID=UPI00136458CD|nr:hypothetical protein [Nitrosopumilus piranensis]
MIPFLILGFFVVLQIPAHALESEPLIAKNTNNDTMLTGIVGQPITFETTITNNEENSVDFEVGFSTRTMKNKILDHQMLSVHLESGGTTTITYQFTPSMEGNYVSGISYGGIGLIHDHITFPALKDDQPYPTETVSIYSDSTDDCLIACTEPSVLIIDAGTVVEFSNTTPDIRRMSTGSYIEGKDGFHWSSDDRFHSMIFPDRTSSFLFSQSGEYQLSLAEHRSTDVIGTIHVMSDQFREANKTFNILNKIMNDEDYGIPISSLYLNPKNSVITVGINDKHNPLFSLDTYKTMIYKQVGNVYLNIVSDHDSFRTELCDVNDEFAVRAMLEKDPVVKQFLQSYPSATFEHFKTGDEPGNPRTYSEFHHGIFLLRVLVSTYDPNGVCYHVYGYQVSYDDPNSKTKKAWFENPSIRSENFDDAIIAVKKLSSPLNQLKSEIPTDKIQCNDDLVLVQKYDGSPACVTESTKQKLIERGWTETESSDDIKNNSNLIRQNIARIEDGYISLYPENMCASLTLDFPTEQDIQRYKNDEKGLSDANTLQITSEDLKEIPELQELIHAVHSIEFPYNKHSSVYLDGLTLVEYEFFLMEKSMKKYGDTQGDYFMQLDGDYEERLTNPAKQGLTNHFESPTIVYNDNVYSIDGTYFWTSNEHDPRRMGVYPQDSIKDDEKFIILTDEDMESVPKIKEAIENIGKVKESISARKGLPEDQQNQYREWFGQKSQDRLNSDTFRVIQYEGHLYSIGFGIC